MAELMGHHLATVGGSDVRVVPDHPGLVPPAHAAGATSGENVIQNGLVLATDDADVLHVAAPWLVGPEVYPPEVVPQNAARGEVVGGSVAEVLVANLSHPDFRDRVHLLQPVRRLPELVAGGRWTVAQAFPILLGATVDGHKHQVERGGWLQVQLQPVGVVTVVGVGVGRALVEDLDVQVGWILLPGPGFGDDEVDGICYDVSIGRRLSRDDKRV